MSGSTTSPSLLWQYGDTAVKLAGAVTVFVVVLTVGVVWYYFTPKYTRVGYQPKQPAPFSHEFHVGELGMSCKYCHTNVDQSPHSNVPATQTCMNCHTRVKTQSPQLAAVRDSWESGEPVRWNQVHRVPDYAYFNHAVHVNRGVSCQSCHGKVNEMKVVHHDQPLSMSWCLDCHHNPAPHLRPQEEIYNLDWEPAGGETRLEIGQRLQQELQINPPETCQACHR